MNTGSLIWITGLSGAGKTTLAKRLQQDMIACGKSVVLLDGDDLRQVYGLENQYTFNQRLAMAKRHARMCHLLTAQNINVICATISMFDEVRNWNRAHQQSYTEIFLNVSFPTRSNRSSLYGQLQKDSCAHLVGFDVDAELPTQADIVLSNEGSDGIDSVFHELKSQLNYGMNNG
jgi:adenylylsulfate kinase-like enzyme